ncbi:MAG: protein kinase [Thermodesulfobacteriota bacterium]
MNTEIKSIGKYPIRSRLGQGAMGQVYKVILPGENRFAALKVLKPGPDLINKMGMEWIYEQFIQEFKMLSDLRHPGLVSVWGLEQDDTLVYYVMEYFYRNLGLIMGESYWADRPSRVLRVEKAVGYILETLDGLGWLHRAGIVHRDIKPFNLMLTEADAIKITDLGLSRRRGERPAGPGNVMIGTPYYAAPEQVAAPEKADHRADLYSMGVMLYRMLTGILPQQPLKRPGALNPELDDGWDELILKSIHPDPDKRFQDAESMSHEIRTRYRDFSRQKQAACNLADDSGRRITKEESGPVLLRSVAERVPANRAASVFQIDEYHRPRQYLKNSFGAVTDGVMVDATTNLAWQQAGSESVLPWDQAHAYIFTLNRRKFGGYENWRLPTVNELLSLLNPPPPGEDFCFQSAMSSVQKWIWSGDTRSKRAAWFMDGEMGFVASGDILDGFHVKAVCSV